MTPPASEAPEPALTDLVAQLRAERDGLRRAMRTRAVIEQAKGILMVRLGIGPDEAFDELARMSQHTNIRLAEVAAALVGGVAPEPKATAPDRVGQAGPGASARQAGNGSPTPAASDDTSFAGTAPDDSSPARTAPGGRPHPDAERARPAPPAERPRQPAAAEPRPGASGPGRTRSAGVAPTADTPAQRLAAQHQLLAARIAAADSYDALVAAFAETDRGWSRPASVGLALAEPDGALRLVAAVGLSAEVRSQWSRIPPQVDIPLAVAVRTGEPVLLPDPDAVAAGYPVLASLAERPGAVAALPLVVADRCVGAVSLGWSSGQPLDELAGRYLVAAAEVASRRLGALAGKGTAVEPTPAVGTQPWLEAVLAALAAPAAVLAPVLADGVVVDLAFEHVNPAGLAFAADHDLDLHGARLLAVLPGAGSQVLLPMLRQTLETGAPSHADQVFVADSRGARRGYRCTFHATRLWDRVMLTWQQTPERELLVDQLLAGERLARTGSFWWDVNTGEVRWSPQLHAIFERPLSRPPMDMAELFDYIDARAVTQALKGRDPVSVTVRAKGERWLRMTAERIRDEQGAVTAVRGTVQEITDERAAEARRRRVEEALAAQRQRARVEEALADAFQQALLPTRGELPPVKGLEVRAVCQVAPREGRVPTTWYDTIPLRDDETLLVVGEVFGPTPDSLVTAARICNAIRGYAVLDMDVAQMLDALDRMISQLFPSERATVALAHFDRSRRRMWCASAGHSQPIRYRERTESGLPCGSLGPPIGEGRGGYRSTEVEMLPGDVLLLHTDGLVARGSRDARRGLDALLASAGTVDLGDPDAVIRHLGDELGAPPDNDLCVITGRVQ